MKFFLIGLLGVAQSIRFMDNFDDFFTDEALNTAGDG